MIENLPAYISILFILTTAATLCLFYWVVKNATVEATRKKAAAVSFGLMVWLIIQAILTLQHVYNTNLGSTPPRLLFGIAPTILVILFLFATAKGRRFIDSLPVTHLTYLHSVRVPVELVLYALFLYKAVPQLMTFEGRNFDILAGITAPFISYFGLVKQKLSRRIILIWNLVCLALLLNIVAHALLAAPSPLQKLAFDQPNIAIQHFPFSWLATFIVPIVLFAHLASIRQLSLQPVKK